MFVINTIFFDIFFFFNTHDFLLLLCILIVNVKSATLGHVGACKRLNNQVFVVSLIFVVYKVDFIIICVLTILNNIYNNAYLDR